MIFEISFKMMLVFFVVFLFCAWLLPREERDEKFHRAIMALGAYSIIAAFVALIIAIMSFGVA